MQIAGLLLAAGGRTYMGVGSGRCTDTDAVVHLDPKKRKRHAAPRRRQMPFFRKQVAVCVRQPSSFQPARSKFGDLYCVVFDSG
jgi:hypothetical protein